MPKTALANRTEGAAICGLRCEVRVAARRAELLGAPGDPAESEEDDRDSSRPAKDRERRRSFASAAGLQRPYALGLFSILGVVF